MGRDVTGLRNATKSSVVNVKSNSNVSPKALPETDESKDYEAEEHTVKGTVPDERSSKQEVLSVQSTNHEPVGKNTRAEASESSVNEATDTNDANRAEVDHSDGKPSQQLNDTHSPKTTKSPQPNSPPMSTKQLQLHDKKYYDEEDNWSMASSTATSGRTIKPKITVPVAPRFTCTDRLERRKEFYTKLEEKHKALEKERLEYEARTKEEEQKVIKQLRKSMVVKAKPVPSFYREGPPPKVELKKLPVTRAKSPNLTRRKSFGDAVKTPSPVDKGPRGLATRHSVGVYKVGGKSPPIAPKGKDRVGVRKLNERNKVNDHPKEVAAENSQVTAEANAVEC